MRSARVASSFASTAARPLVASTSSSGLASTSSGHQKCSHRTTIAGPSSQRWSSSTSAAAQSDPIDSLTSGSLASHMLHTPRIPAGKRVSPAFLSLLYSTLVPPPLATLNALAARIPHANLIGHTQLVEQCCISPTFWDAVASVGQPPAELNWTKGDGPASGYTHYCDEGRLDNEELATLGSTLLGLFATEWIQAKYPHLPTDALASAVTSYTGKGACADLARSWGIFAGSASIPPLMNSNKLPQEPLRGTGEAYRAGTGPLRWSLEHSNFKPFYKPRGDDEGKALQMLKLEDALSEAARALIGAVHQVHGFSAAREFAHAHWLARPINMLAILKFRNPGYTLSATLARYNLPPVDIRMLKESGRDTHLPIFIVGAFSGTRKLGEGFGSSIAMAQKRAQEDALRRIYLSRSFAQGFDMNQKPTDADGLPSLPSDTLASPDGPAYKPTPLGDEVIEAMSGGRTGVRAQDVDASPFRENGQPMPKNKRTHPGPFKLRKRKQA